jgi:hypothetical protein
LTSPQTLLTLASYVAYDEINQISRYLI